MKSVLDGQDPFELPENRSIPYHRRLEILISDDGMKATLDRIFPTTKLSDITQTLAASNVSFGILHEKIENVLRRAWDTGDIQKDTVVALGREPLDEKQNRFHFLEKNGPKQQSLKFDSEFFRIIPMILKSSDFEQVRRNMYPGYIALPDQLLVENLADNSVEPGINVLGQNIWSSEMDKRNLPDLGEGVYTDGDGNIRARDLGYVATTDNVLSVHSPIWIADNKRSAFYLNFPLLNPHNFPSPEIIVENCMRNDIIDGLLRRAIFDLCDDQLRSNLSESCILIANLPEPIEKHNYRLNVRVPDESDFIKTEQILQSRELYQIEKGALDASMVRPGEDLAISNLPEQKTDISGKLLSDRHDMKWALDAGENVTVRAPNRTCRIYESEIFGYVGLTDTKLMVLPPIWVSRDRMEAYLLVIPEAIKKANFATADLETAVQQAGILVGMENLTTDQIISYVNTTSDPGWVKLASGKSPVCGSDGDVELNFSNLPKPGELFENGKIDFRNRQAFVPASKGDLLALRRLPREGENGYDLRGKVLKAPRPERPLLFAGSRVEEVKENGVSKFYAKGPGVPRITKDTLSVHNLFVYPKDVGFEVGNLDMDGDIEIQGSVRSGFSVSATGNVTISGAVEAGVHITSGGDVYIGKAIINSKVISSGDVYAQFVNRANIYCGGSLLVSKYILNSTVIAEENIIVRDKKNPDKFTRCVGGELLFGKELVCHVIGSPVRNPTRIVAGYSAEKEKQLKRYKKGIGFLDVQIHRFLNEISKVMKVFSVKQFENLNQNLRKPVVQRIEKIKKFKNLKEMILKQIEDTTMSKGDLVENTLVKVLAQIHPGVVLQFGETNLEVKEKSKGCFYKWCKRTESVIRDISSR